MKVQVSLDCDSCLFHFVAESGSTAIRKFLISGSSIL